MGPHMSSRQHQRVESICVVTDDIGWSVSSMGAFCCRNDVPGTCFFYLFFFFVRAHVQYSFVGLIMRTPPPTFSDTAITDRHSDTTIF